MSLTAPKTFILTGAAGGLGTQAVRILAQRDVNVLCVDRDEDSLQRLRQEVSDRRANLEFCVADVSRREDVERYVNKAVELWGGVDGAFHMAGWEGAMREFVDVGVNEFDTMMEINARSVWYGMKYVVPLLLERGGGRIVNTGSYVAFHGTWRTAAYGAAKHAIVGMTRGVAVEHAARNIAINVLAPGAMDTRMIKTVLSRSSPDDPERGLEMILSRTPSRKLADPADVAATGVWLLTESPIHLTGQIVPVDGGSSI